MICKLTKGCTILLSDLLANEVCVQVLIASPIARFMGPIWGPSGADSTQVGPMSLAIWGGSKKYILPVNPLQLPNRTIIAVLTVKFQNDWATEKYVMGKRDFATFDLKLGFGGIF